MLTSKNNQGFVFKISDNPRKDTENGFQPMGKQYFFNGF
jgi:hypothetical protein